MDLKKKFADEKRRHLTDDELDSYYDKTLSAIDKALADAHLRICLICENSLERIRKERVITDDDVALVRRAMQQRKLKPSSSDSRNAEAANSISLKDRFNEYLQQLEESWRAFFGQMEFARGTHYGDEPFWQGQSDDGLMKIYATLRRDAGLTISFSSHDMSLEGMRFSVSLGTMNQEIALQRVSESEARAEIEVTRYQMPIKLEGIKIQPIS
jgi:predicted Zn-dependent peptidase